MTKQQLLARALRCAVALVGMIILSAVSAHAAIINAEPGDQFNLATLIENDDAIIIGDKKFDMWDYVRADVSTNNMPEASAITIIATIIDGNLGVTIQGGFGDIPGDNFLSDASLFYRVMVTDDNKWISDAHLGGNLDIVGDPDATAMISVTEDFFIDDDGELGAQVGQMSITAAQANGEKILDLDAWIFFDQLHKSLKVRKDIIAFASEGVTFPIASLIDQTFSQVPEPATITLIVMAGVTICWAGRRRRRSRW